MPLSRVKRNLYHMAFPVGKRDYERTHGGARFDGGWKEQFKETCLQRAKQYRNELFEKRRSLDFTIQDMKDIAEQTWFECDLTENSIHFEEGDYMINYLWECYERETRKEEATILQAGQKESLSVLCPVCKKKRAQ